MIHEIEFAPLDELMACAAAKRDTAHGRLVSYSRKVFIPLTKLCRDRCAYCTFVTVPGKLCLVPGSPVALKVYVPASGSDTGASWLRKCTAGWRRRKMAVT